MTDHGHSHAAVANTSRRRLAIAFAITVSVLISGVVGAVLTGSLALLVDAAHMLTDAGGLLVALMASILITRPVTARRTWGFQRAEVLAATAQGAVLLAVGLFVVIEGVQRLISPPAIASSQLLLFGIIGLLGNIAAILVLASGRSANLNMRAAFLEVVNDALGSVGVIVAAIVIATTGYTRADAIAGLLIGALILPRALKLLKITVDVLLESTPAGLNLDSVRTHILELPHVKSVHDLHASQIATNLPILTAHVVIDDECFRDGHSTDILAQLQNCVATHFDLSVAHSTFQLEPASHSDHEATPHP